MSVVAARTPPRRRGGRRLLIALFIVVLIVAGLVVWVNLSAQAAVSASGVLTVYLPATSVQHGSSGSFAAGSTGSLVQAGDSVQTDATGRAAVTMPDGTLTRLATNTTVTLDSAHFARSGNLHDAKFVQQIGRTFTNVQHLVSGATFQVAGKSATATVRGTRFEVLIKQDGSMTVKLFDGTLDFDGKNHVHLTAGQQATADANGTVSAPITIQPDPNDPFGPDLAASDAVAANTTPGTEQDFIGAPIHNGEQQQYTYSYAGGGTLKASVGYPGSLMKLTVQAPDNSTSTKTGASPIVVVVNNAPAGIYRIIVAGVSGIGPAGENPFVAVASVESCASADIEQLNAVHRGYTTKDLSSAVQVSGLSNLGLSINGGSVSGAILTGTGTYNGVGWTGTVVLVPRGGLIDITAVSATVFGLSVPSQQIVQQIGSAIGQDPSKVNPGFTVDRLFTCNSVLMVDGRFGS
ncbi:MAG TPA: FecR family protein [Candidatus Dormibacteraeota bacterium]|jgi:hypothetical protein